MQQISVCRDCEAGALLGVYWRAAGYCARWLPHLQMLPERFSAPQEP